MYIEFLIIYIGMGALFLLSITILILLIVLLRKNGDTYVPKYSNSVPQSTVQTTVPSGNIVFCKKCATEFDASQRFCPRCGTPR